MVKRGLGKGFGALIAEETSIDVPSNELEISKIEPMKNQPRKVFDKEALNELANSIKIHGVITPIIVSDTKEGFYQIIAGERRWRAAKIAGLKKIPVVIKEYNEKESDEIALIENLQRENLNAYEEALGYKNLMDKYGYTQEETGKLVSKSRVYITNTLRLLNLPKDALNYVKEGKLSPGHARAVLAVKDELKQKILIDDIINNEISVREAEKKAKSLNEEKEKKVKKELDDNFKNAILETEELLTEKLFTKVKISCNEKFKGKIEIEFYDKESLLKITDELTK